MKILITGVAGFIGFHLASSLLEEGYDVVGLDNLNDYYSVDLKKYRLSLLKKNEEFKFYKIDLMDKEIMYEMFLEENFTIVINLAAQAGVRYSILNPQAYLDSNIQGFFNILEACKEFNIEHLLYASSSSVYGGNTKIPFSTEDNVDHPVSLYAATKKSNELFAHVYSQLYNIPTTGLRFFTVYGPAGRPDMAYFSFTKKLINNETIEIFNYGESKRDFTYIDDIIQAIKLIINKPPVKKIGPDGSIIPPYVIYNLGNNKPESLLDFVQILQEELVRAELLPQNYNFEKYKKFVPMQPGDVPVTYADINLLKKDFDFKPTKNLKYGLRMFVEWYKDYHKCK